MRIVISITSAHFIFVITHCYWIYIHKRLHLRGEHLMSKKLCKIASSDALKDDIKDYIKKVNAPTVVCVKCGRAANEEDMVCKAKHFSKKKKEEKKKD